MPIANSTNAAETPKGARTVGGGEQQQRSTFFLAKHKSTMPVYHATIR